MLALMHEQYLEACDMDLPKVTHEFADVDGARVFYRAAGLDARLARPFTVFVANGGRR